MSDNISKKSLKVEIPCESTEMMHGGIESQVATTTGQGVPVLTRQHSCLCAPTTHAGSFRCRLHRAPSLQRTKSIDSANHRYPTSKAPTSTHDATKLEPQ
ncbi:hypothetical protein CFOL_v3_06548 [Cephalotus follicularis]|uniref:Uncharacterized protein n=1 Tax=Cephalotus follicularis TaxID=3775 RepID=A0A1Q3B4P7_CEPFO|nr:hypothetical protein CFOL_v3_06548 [Cephalotus follicularis]